MIFLWMLLIHLWVEFKVITRNLSMGSMAAFICLLRLGFGLWGWQSTHHNKAPDRGQYYGLPCTAPSRGWQGGLLTWALARGWWGGLLCWLEADSMAYQIQLMPEADELASYCISYSCLRLMVEPPQGLCPQTPSQTCHLTLMRLYTTHHHRCPMSTSMFCWKIQA